ncbi:MAG: hypothetical protein AAF317_07320 [Pseudomonadota bacterium]
MATNKKRLVVYLTHPVFRHLELDTSRPGITYSGVVEQALTLWYSEDRVHAQNNPLLRRLDRMSRADEVHTRKLAVLSDAMGLFIQYFLTLIPEIPEARRDAASSIGAVRYKRFLEDLVTVRSDSSRGVLAQAEDVLADASAFFTKEQLDQLHQPAPNSSDASSTDEGEARND